MARATTLQRQYWNLLSAPSVRLDHCAICGALRPLNQHHVIWRSWGEYYDGCGRRVEKPTITLCGSGNASGCHGKAHQRMLHFRYSYERYRLEYLETEKPTRYIDALGMDGWKAVREQWSSSTS